METLTVNSHVQKQATYNNIGLPGLENDDDSLCRIYIMSELRIENWVLSFKERCHLNHTNKYVLIPNLSVFPL